ncbi:hypothetical protein [Bacteroides acidifaciens]|uniref:hypothetical protein n=1 Tax=Bacteroides acidifaciens TaxID=85831 RepID=UPI0025AA0162|nr:hypothetical protein [Bacteroides acidifaciens]
MKKRFINSDLAMIDRLTQQENESIKGGKVKVKGTVSVKIKDATGSIEVSNHLIDED